MASFTFTNESLKINLSPAESRVIGRPSISLDKSRLKAFKLIDMPERVALGQKVSRPMLFNSLVGEYRTSSLRTLVLGKAKGSEQVLKITISHPSIDQVLVCGAQASELESKLVNFLSNK